jgi:hypothetical protein
MKNTRGSGGFRRLELAADRFFDTERVLAIVIGEISDRPVRYRERDKRMVRSRQRARPFDSFDCFAL